MNIRSILVGLIGFMGTQYLGYPILYGLIAFNLVLWLDIIYNLVFSANTKVRDEIFTEVQPTPVNEAQIAFERWIIQKYLETLIDNAPDVNAGIQLLEESQLISVET